MRGLVGFVNMVELVYILVMIRFTAENDRGIFGVHTEYGYALLDKVKGEAWVLFYDVDFPSAHDFYEITRDILPREDFQEIPFMPYFGGYFYGDAETLTRFVDEIDNRIADFFHG